MIGSLFQAAYSAVFPPSKLLELPLEIWIGILSYSTAQELARMLRISRSWCANASTPCLWKEIKLQNQPHTHPIALKSFFARARDTLVAIEIRTDGKNTEPSRFSQWEAIDTFDLLRAHVSHIRALNLRVCDITPRYRVEVPLKDITGPEFSSLRSLLETPMPMLKNFSIKMRWDVLSKTIPRPFNSDAPNLRTFKMLFQGLMAHILDTRILPRVEKWHFERESYPLIWPWDWNEIWSALSSRGYLTQTEVLFTSRFDASNERPDMMQLTNFDKWTVRQLELGRDPAWSDTGAVFILDSSLLPVRARIEFILGEHYRMVMFNPDVLRHIGHLVLHDKYEWYRPSNREVLPPIPPTSMPSLKTLTINCLTPRYRQRHTNFTVNLLQPSIVDPGRKIVAPNLDDIRIQRWAKDTSQSVVIDAVWLAHFLDNHVEKSSARFRRLVIGTETGLEFRQGLDESLKLLARLTDSVQVC